MALISPPLGSGGGGGEEVVAAAAVVVGNVVVCSSSGNCESLLNSFFFALLVAVSVSCPRVSMGPPSDTGSLFPNSDCRGGDRGEGGEGDEDEDEDEEGKEGEDGEEGKGTRRRGESERLTGVNLVILVLCGGLQAALLGGDAALRLSTGPILRMRTESAAGDMVRSTTSSTGSRESERAMRATLIGTAPLGMYRGTTIVSAPRYSGSCPAASSTSDLTPKSPLTWSRSAS